MFCSVHQGNLFVTQNVFSCTPDAFSTVFTHLRYRGSYMSARVLLNLFNELRKSNKMRGLPSILSHFRNKFNKFNNTRAQMLDSIYHMTLKLLKI